MEFNEELIPLSDRELDLEYRKYRLFAYLQRISERFKEKRLYPHLSELKDRYSELLSFKGKKEDLSSSFPRELKGFDPEGGYPIYERKLEDEGFLEGVDRLIEIGLPYIREQLEEGEELRHSVMEHIRVHPVGLLPLQKKEGYLLLARAREWRVYRYYLNRVQTPSADRRYRDLRTRYLTSFRRIDEPQRIKQRLLREEGRTPIPAVYWVESEWPLPRIETLLPIAKQVLMRLPEGPDPRLAA